MNIDMVRNSGAISTVFAEQIDRHDIWRIRTDIRPEYNKQLNSLIGVTFIETEFLHKPTITEIKDFVYSVINKQTEEKIISGFVWNNINVWLSAENQRNFSEAARMAEEGLIRLPITFKLGEDENGEAVYYTFETVKELSDFYADCFIYINQCLNDGWVQKDSVDWTVYENILNNN